MSDYVKGVVPGTVFTAYVEAGIVSDPNYADNIYKVDETFYNRPFWYRTEFELPSSYSEGRRVWLHFDNTNRFADFYFNGEKISGTKTSTKDVSGHMLRSKFDVTNLMGLYAVRAGTFGGYHGQCLSYGYRRCSNGRSLDTLGIAYFAESRTFSFNRY